MSDAESLAVDRVVKHGYADRTTSRRIVREVIDSLFGDGAEPFNVEDNDIHQLDELGYDIMCLIWEMQAVPSIDHRTYLLDILDRTQQIMQISRRYVAPETRPGL